MIIRPEIPADMTPIRHVTVEAFRDHPHSDQTEHLIIERLRKDDALAVSLVAEEDGAVVGHIALSAVTLSDGSPWWYVLGPLSVLPERQGKGVGRRLVDAGLERLKVLNAGGCVVLGDPDYYRRFGLPRILPSCIRILRRTIFCLCACPDRRPPAL